jgi:raffinose/stachyose/melibiose transport system substrate-binding protein
MKRIATLLATVGLVAACSSGAGASPATPQAASNAPAASASTAASGSTAAGSASAAASGSASGSAAASSTASGNVNLLVGIAEDPAIEKQLNAQVEDFNSTHPNIHVTRESLDNDQLRTIIQTRLSSGSVDIFSYDTGPGFGGVLAKAGLLADMTPAYQKYGWPIFDWAKARCTYSGVLSCVPGQVEELGIYYNKDLFDQNGLQPPKTLDEFNTLSNTLKSKGITPLAFGDQPKWPAGHQFSMTLSNIVGREGLDARLYGDKPWNDADTVKAIDVYFKQFKDAGFFPKDPNAVTYEDANALFYAGKAAMDPTGTWLVSEITNKAKFTPGFMPFPAINGTQIAQPAGLGGGMFVAKNAKNPDAAFEYLNWLLQPEQIRKYDLEQFNSIPAMKIDTTGVKVSPLFQQVLDDLAQSSGTTGTFGYNIDVLTPAAFNDQMGDGFQEVLSGKLTPQQQADKLQAAYQKAMAAGETIKKP